MWVLLKIFAVSVSLLVGSLSAMAADKAIIAMDASGSMWGQFDGKTKIEIAREILGKVLSGVPLGLALGLIAYDHRQKGQYADIEEMVSIGTGQRTEVSMP